MASTGAGEKWACAHSRKPDSGIIVRVKNRRVCITVLLRISVGLLLAAPTYPAQALGGSEASLAPGPKPAPAPLDVSLLVGIYGQGQTTIIILERDGRLFYRNSDGAEIRIHRSKPRSYEGTLPDLRKVEILLPRNNTFGVCPFLRIGATTYKRADGGASAWFHVTPLHAIGALVGCRANPKERANAKCVVPR